MWTELSFTGKAYCKIILHAAKYPHCSVNGILLAEASKLKANRLIIVDTVPLFHIQLNLTPMGEIGLAQIEQWASKLGLAIAGYYTANENFKENSLDKAAQHRIAEKIAENVPNACLVVVDNRNLSLNLDNLSIKVGQFTTSTSGQYPASPKCRPIDICKVLLDPDHVLDACSSLLKRQVYKALIDFDNHLDDITGDWTNPQINVDVEDILKYHESID